MSNTNVKDDELTDSRRVSNNNNSLSASADTLFDCLHANNNSNTINLPLLRKLSSQGIPSELRALTWRILLGYLPLDPSEWDDHLLAKRRDYLELVSTIFSAASDVHHGDELIFYDESHRNRPLSLRSLNASSNSAPTTTPIPLPQAAKDQWKETGRDMHVLERLVRDAGLAHTLRIHNEDNDFNNDNNNNNNNTLWIQSALALDEIKKDVIRTQTALPIFQQADLGARRHAALERILLCVTTATETPYVQGMYFTVCVDSVC
jgi:hypothetical protein